MVKYRNIDGMSGNIISTSYAQFEQLWSKRNAFKLPMQVTIAEYIAVLVSLWIIL